MKYLLGLMMVGVLVGCQSITPAKVTGAPKVVAPTEQPTKSIQNTWQLAQVQGTDSDSVLNTMLKTQAVTMDLSTLPKSSAYAGCNRLGFVTQAQNGSFAVEHIIATRMYCAEVMALESLLLTQLPKMTHYTTTATQLILQGGGVTLTFVAQQ